MTRYLSSASARRVYDRIGRLEDSQAFYEDPALDALLSAGGFETVDHVLEFGCGTGRLAERLLEGYLPDTARYAGCDISGRMTGLSTDRLARFGPRVTLWQSDGSFDFTPAAPPVDRIVTTYVLDLLPPERIAAFLSAAHAALAPGGRLCAASITPGEHWPSSMISAAWTALHRLSPLLVGGCRPIRLSQLLPADHWTIRHRSLRVAWGVASEVVIATPR